LKTDWATPSMQTLDALSRTGTRFAYATFWTVRCGNQGTSYMVTYIHACMHIHIDTYHVPETHGQDYSAGATHTHTHTHTQMILSGCWLWLYVGVVLLALPLCFFLFGLYICRKLFSEGSFKYTPTPQYSIKEIYRRSTKAAGCWAKVSTFLVAVLDIRFKGDWGKGPSGEWENQI